MKRNPRNEELFALLKGGLEGKEWLDEVLQEIVECEMHAYNSLIIYDSDGSNTDAVKLSVLVDPESGGYVLQAARKVSILSTKMEWEKLPSSTEGCEEVRILKQGELVLVECTEPVISTDEAMNIIRKMKIPAVLCYYEWE